ncbi:hypothetical protein LG201_04305 [Methylobacillus gramineus]|uniref:hypothetical protein n=1 Tax=Methylobacillus gramineus TaxID=755169 RepID=UPI001CFFA792|nr:hypothetical protein [Methylobacillus gramineus]MCB5184422.1 hypothetical protein [Methylobacillus gramineus]
MKFIYKKNGAIEARVVHMSPGWVEDGQYLCGREVGDTTHKTFLKYKISEYIDGSEKELIDPFPEPPPKPSEFKHKPTEVLFTGFASARKDELIDIALNKGMHVPKNVTTGLRYLCVGSNAGHAKVGKARSQNVLILQEKQFLLMLETGEIPELNLGF